MRVLGGLLLCMLLTSCSGMTPGSVMEITNEAGEVVGKITDTTAQRDYFYTQQHIQRDFAYQRMYAKSGVKVSFKQVTLADGSMAYLPEELSVRAAPQFQQDLETRPPDHVGWKTANKAFDFLTFGLGAYFLTDFGKHAVDSSGSSFFGDYNINSHNPVDNSTPIFLSEGEGFPMPVE